MNKLFTIFSVLFLTTLITAQTPKVQWTKGIGGKGNDRANSIVTDSKGNIVLVGRFQSPTIDLGKFTLTKSIEDKEDVADVFIIKLDVDGNPIWALSAGGKGDDHATSCTVDKKNNIYVVGWFESKTLAFGTIKLSRKSVEGSDMYVAKFTPKGKCIWARNAGGAGSNGDYSTIALDNENNVLISGYAGIQMTFETGKEIRNEKSGMYCAKYSNAGQLLWINGSPNADCQGISVDKENNVYVGGYAKNYLKFDDFESILIKNESTDVYAAKLNSNGKLIWITIFGGSDTEIASCETDPSGNVFLAGLYMSKQISNEKDTLKNNGLVNAFIVKYDNKGNYLWSKTAGGNADDKPATATREFYIDETGAAYCTGSNWSEFIFAGKTVKTVSGSEDIFLMKYDKNGNEMWCLDYGGSGRNAGRGITTDKKGNIFLTGSFDEKELKIEDQTLKNQGDSDIFIVKFIEEK